MIFSDYTGQEMPNFDAVLENYGVNRVDGLQPISQKMRKQR